MRYILVLILTSWPLLLRAQKTAVDVRGVTATQAIIHARVTNADGTPFTGSCTYRISEGQSFTALVNDVNPALFAGSNSDARPGSLISGSDRFFVAGARTATQAADGKFYSRALQAASPHWAGVTCGTGPEVSVVFTTKNPPLGNSYPEFPAFDPKAFGNRAEPTIDFSDNSKSYIDPLTGLLLKRVTSPSDSIDTDGVRWTFAYARDVIGNGWSNSQNAITNQSPSTLASTSTPNAPLFLSWTGLASTNNFDFYPTPNDIRLRAYCSGTNGGTLQACISLDSGNSCATDTIDIACPAALGEADGPSNYPSPMFQGWGTQHQTLTKVLLSNQPSPAVRVSGNHVIWYSGNQFYAERAPGSKILLQGTAPACAGNVCTLKSIDSPTQITIQENVLTDAGGSTLTGAVAAGATSLTVNGAVGLLPGNHIQLDQGVAGQETVQVAAAYTIGSTTVPLQSPVLNAHAAGAVAYWGGLDDAGDAGPNPWGHLAPTGTLAGATTVTLIDTAAGLAPGETMVIDAKNPTQESVKVALNYQIGSLTVPLQTPLQFSHSQGYPPPVSWSNATREQEYGGGILTWLKNTGGSPSISASFTFDHTTSQQYQNSTNPELDTCSTLPINDISTDKLGNPISPPLSGYLCNFGGQNLVLWIPSTGEARRLSVFYLQGQGRMSVPLEAFSNIDPKTVFASSRGNGHVYKAVLNNPPGVYTEYDPGPTNAPVPDNLVWTDLTATTAPIEQQLASYGGPAAAAYASGLFPKFTFSAVIGGYGVYDTWSGASDGPCLKIRTLADTNTLVQAFDSWDNAPLRWGGCHSSPVGSGSLLNLSMNPLQDMTNSAPMGGPYTLAITQMKRAGVWTTYSQPITAASNASPVTFTAVGSGIDEYVNAYFSPGTGVGPTITISGGTGAWAAVNGTWSATVPFGDSDHFTIPVNTSSFGPVSGNLVFSAAPPLIHSTVTSISQTSPAIVTTNNNFANEPLNDRFQDGDPIAFANLPNTQQYYVKVTGHTSNSFAVYQDPQLTQPVSGSALAGAASGMVYFAETCPSGLPSSLTTNMIFDSVGATGVRCITVRVNGEPCSAFATAAEHSKYPCKADPTNPAKSGLTDVEVGDAIRDLTRGAYDETFVVLQKVKNSENDIELTLMRWYGNEITGDNHATNPISNSHDVGWTPLMVPSNSHSSATGWMDATDPTNTFISASPLFSEAHGDFGYGNAPGLLTYVAGLQDHILNKPIRELLATPPTFTKNEHPAWADSPGTQLNYAFDQSYPGHRQFNTPPSENVWKGDWFALNPSFGNGGTYGANLVGGITVTNIAGTAYDSNSTTTHVYKISNAAGAFDRKRTPTYAWAGKWMFQDMSGPGSLITDANIWSYCVADNPGECRPGSATDDVFLTGSNLNTSGGICLTNTLNISAPCFTGANPLGGWAMQIGIDPIDTTARRMRRLTLGFTAPGMHWSFSNWLQSPGGKWGFFTTAYANGLRNDFFAMKLPPWPALDTVNRTTFISVPVKLAAAAGSPYARARFGYAEDGDPSQLFCTSRREGCSTEIPAAAPADPYSFIGEAPSHADCSAGCTVNIPAVPGRVLYYIVDRMDSNGNVISSSPMKAVAIP